MILITGGSRSGKSQFAEKCAVQTGLPVIYIATGSKPDPDQDPEWAERIRQHIQRRPTQWQTIESGLELAPLLSKSSQNHPQACYLVDSLGGWVAAGLDLNPQAWVDWTEQLLTALKSLAGQVIVVSEEVGSGLVPAYATGRLFRDRIGLLAQKVGSDAEAVYWVTAGFALDLKQLGQSVF